MKKNLRLLNDITRSLFNLKNKYSDNDIMNGISTFVATKMGHNFTDKKEIEKFYKFLLSHSLDVFDKVNNK